MLNTNVAQLLNTQINKEFYSAYLYLEFSNYYEAEGIRKLVSCAGAGRT